MGRKPELASPMTPVSEDMSGKKLIYIIGAGRSGTTVLDIVLGNAEGALSLGEINRFFRRDGIPPARNDGEPAADFWARFRTELEKTRPECADYAAMRKTMHANEYHSASLSVLAGKADPVYRQTIATFYDLLSRQTEAEILIESSKYPLRALHISRILRESPLEISYVYLKRDPVKVVRSFRKKGLEQPPKGFFTSNLYYLFVNTLCSRVVSILKKRGHRVSKITFEALTGKPVETLGRVQKELDIDLSQAIGRIAKQSDLEMGLLFDGNRIRLKDSIRLQSGTGNKLEMDLEAYLTRAFNFLIYR